MTPTERLIRRIELTGPLSIADYMTECLLNPTDGYYTTGAPIGRSGDFVTSPEISQMFGELIGLALAQCWIDQDRPTPFALAELGPGRGTLMADVLRATKGVPGFHVAAELHLVEASPLLEAEQKRSLHGYSIAWHREISSLPDLPLFLIANEFFDALPMRQFIRDGAAWRERVVGVSSDGELAFGLTDAAPIAALDAWTEDIADGDLVELSAAGEAIAGEIGDRISRSGGAAFVIDYGHWGDPGDTFQAVFGHRKVGVLDAPGKADLTAHVDFRALARAAQPAQTSAMTPQGVFLERLGITARAQALAAHLDDSRLETHIAAHRRLTHPEEMGSLFQVLAIFPTGAPVPPGVDP